MPDAPPPRLPWDRARLAIELTPAQLDELPAYLSSLPTGKWPGKLWRSGERTCGAYLLTPDPDYDEPRDGRAGRIWVTTGVAVCLPGAGRPPRAGWAWLEPIRVDARGWGREEPMFRVVAADGR